jgi:2-polyprenyl-3-methyl-5-hydroxy-6-metoxy-1,4-benzoquinol methylase
MVDKELVRACYSAILGREADNDAVVDEKIKWISSPEALIRDFLTSPEFQNQLPRQVKDNYLYEALPIEVDVSEAQKEALFLRLRRQWAELGQNEPYWSVLTHEEYRAANMDAVTLASFYETGAYGGGAGLIDLFCARNRVEVRRGTCVELGCGVGRVTKHLAEQFESVIAIDISEGNLRQCALMAERLGLANIECRLLQSPDDLCGLPEFDFFFSTIVLQHNPPPIQKHQLDVLLGKIKHGGGFLFQTQTYSRDYSFEVDRYLATPVETMDMHCLPMHEALRLIEKHGLCVREVVIDGWTGRWGSHTFFGCAPSR